MKNLLWVVIFFVGGYFGYQEILAYKEKRDVETVYLVLDKLYRVQQAQFFRAGKYLHSLKGMSIPEQTDSGYKIIMNVAKDGRSYSAKATNGLKTFTIDSSGQFQEFVKERLPNSQ